MLTLPGLFAVNGVMDERLRPLQFIGAAIVLLVAIWSFFFYKRKDPPSDKD